MECFQRVASLAAPVVLLVAGISILGMLLVAGISIFGMLLVAGISIFGVLLVAIILVAPPTILLASLILELEGGVSVELLGLL